MPLVLTMPGVFVLKIVPQPSRMFVLQMDEVLTMCASFNWRSVELEQITLTSIMEVAEVNNSPKHHDLSPFVA